MAQLKLKHRLRAIFFPSESRAYKEREHVKKQMRAGQLYLRVSGGHCERCNTDAGFFYGPQGGAARNMHCANNDCRATYNVMPLGDGTGHAELVGSAQDTMYERAREGAFD